MYDQLIFKEGLKTMNILITGAGGQLGSDCARLLSGSSHVTGVEHSALDIADAAKVRSAIETLRPDVLINCAAFTKVDACESEIKKARAVNAQGPENLAKAMERIGGRIVHISTDYVFDGAKKVPGTYTEADAVNPLSTYGRTKLSGEQAVQAFCNRHMILRTAWVYGINGSNFLKTMLRLSLSDANKTLRVVNDQFGCPTWSYRLARQIQALIETQSSQGIYHAVSEGYCTWYELARHFLEKMQVPHSLIPCATEEYPTAARRPKNSILENCRLKQEGLSCMPDWKADVDEFVARFRDRLLQEALSTKYDNTDR